MATYFIIKNNDPRVVWNFIRREWCFDIDAEYGTGFEYSTYAAAIHRREALAATGLTVQVVTRHRLFELLEVRDWAGRSR